MLDLNLRAPATTPVRSGFRPDIQALRALAVAAVVAYHLWPQQVPGGFVGVDVFFVISGFLITQHLLREHERTGRVSLARFWARRIRRLLPAALTVLGASLVLLVAVMPRVTWRTTTHEVAASAGYVQNWLLGIRSVDYLAAHHSPSLAQHYWSLSVEEQFYLLWPLGFLLVAGLARRRSLPTRKALAAAVAALVLVSFAVGVALTARSPELAFFATPARAWEFGVGGLLALLPTGRSHAWATRLGVATVVASTVAITGAQPFPGWVAAVPVAGAALVVLGRHTGPLGRHPAVQWLGDCSYSVYLWHWPLVVAAPWALGRDLAAPDRLALLLATLALAHVTTRRVERPFRDGARWQGLRRTYALAAAGMLAVGAGAAVVHGVVQHDVQERAEAAARSLAADAPCFGVDALLARCDDAFARPTEADLAFADADVHPSSECQTPAAATRARLCRFGTLEDPRRTVALVGNSHAAHLVPALEQWAQDRRYQVVLAASTDCLGATGLDGPCAAWSADVQERLLAMPRLDAVVFASHLGARRYLAGPDPDVRALARAEAATVGVWERYADAGTPVLVVDDVPGTRPHDAPECIAADPGDDPCSLPRRNVVRDNLLSQLARQHPDLVSTQRTAPWFCDAERCHASVGGVVVYSDSHHLTATYARTLADELGSSVERLWTLTPPGGSSPARR